MEYGTRYGTPCDVHYGSVRYAIRYGNPYDRVDDTARHAIVYSSRDKGRAVEEPSGRRPTEGTAETHKPTSAVRHAA